MGIAKFSDIQIHYQQLDAASSSQHEELVLIHGFAANLGTWYFNIAPALTQFGRVTMLDLRGHGRSTMPSVGYCLRDFISDLEQMLNFLGIQQAHLLGHSLGGAIAIAFAQSYPNRTKSLTLADARIKPFQPVIKAEDLNLKLEIRKLLQAELGIQTDDNCTEQSYDLLIKLISARIDLPDYKFNKILQYKELSGLSSVTKLSPRAARKILDLVNTTSILMDLRNDDSISISSLNQLNLPTLAIYGENSHTLASGLALKNTWPHLHWQLIPEAGHFFPLSRPMALIAPMIEFLKFHPQLALSHA